MSAVVGLLRLADGVLRGEPARLRPRDGWTQAELARVLLVFGMLYGSVMGCHGGLGGDRGLQVLYSAIKLPFMLGATFGIALPSFFVINTLFGLRSEFPRVIQALLAAQAGLTVVLASLAPLTLFVYISGVGYSAAIVFNGLMFAAASASAQILLRREYTPLILQNPRHASMLRIWLCIYVFVGIQMGWIMRPFVGDPDIPVQFFREGSFTNAYVSVWRIVLDALGFQGRK